MEQYGVSVVIPSYNRRDAVVRALDSVLSQDYPNLECIVVDDASTDGSGEMLRGLAGDREALRVIELEQNAGQGAARNVGARAARGRWVCFLDSDDELLPGSIESRVSVFVEDPDFDGIAFGGNIVAGKSEVLLPGSVEKGEDISLHDYLKDRGWLHTNAFMISRERFLALDGFREDLRQKQDVEFFIRALCRVNARYCGQACSRMHDLGDVRARNHHERIARQGYRFVDAVRTNPEVQKRVEPDLLKDLVSRGVSTYLSALYRTGQHSQFRKSLRRSVRQGELSPSSRWLKGYLLSWLRSPSN